MTMRWLDGNGFNRHATDADKAEAEAWANDRYDRGLDSIRSVGKHVEAPKVMVELYTYDDDGNHAMATDSRGRDVAPLTLLVDLHPDDFPPACVLALIEKHGHIE